MIFFLYLTKVYLHARYGINIQQGLLNSTDKGRNNVTAQLNTKTVLKIKGEKHKNTNKQWGHGVDEGHKDQGIQIT